MTVRNSLGSSLFSLKEFTKNDLTIPGVNNNGCKDG